VQNGSFTFIVFGKTPCECWTSRKPCTTHFHIFGWVIYEHVHEKKRQKFDVQFVKRKSIGYGGHDGVKGYHL
jgi:hypothetical protein